MNRRCNTCGKTKPLDAFYRLMGEYRSRKCKLCQNRADREKYAREKKPVTKKARMVGIITDERIAYLAERAANHLPLS